MSIEIIKQWSRNLWSYYLQQISSGNPFYLAVDTSVLLETCPSSIEVPNPNNIESIFHSQCEYAYIRQGRYLALSELALKSHSSNKSLAICLAAQQVAVVSRMVEDDQFSRDEYFPRFREALGLPLHNANPLREEFFAIWKVLEKEIGECAGSSSQTITFKEGTGRKDRSRFLPFSQALLSQHDLVTLHSLWNLDLEKLDPISVVRFLDRGRLKLTRRGQRLCMIEGQRAKVIKQLIEYVRKPITPYVIRTEPQIVAASEVRGDLVVFWQEVGLEERFIVRLLVGAEHEISGSELINQLTTRLNSKRYVLFEDDGIKFTDLVVTREIGPKESFIILCEQNSASALLAEIVSRGASKSNLEQLPCDVSDRYGLILCRAGLGTPLPADFCYSNSASSSLPRQSLEVEGGIIMDGRNNTFLCGYAPSKILLNGVLLGGTETIRLNDVECSVDEALCKISLVNQFEVFEIRQAQSTTIFRMSNKRELNLNSKQLGFRWLDTGRIFPVCERLERKSIGLISFCFQDKNSHCSSQESTPLSLEILLSFIKVPLKSWLPISEAQASTIHARINSSSVPKALKQLINHRLGIIKKVPVNVLTLVRTA